MTPKAALFSLVLATGLALAGCSKSSDRPVQGTAAPARVADGAGLFTDHCQRCHGAGAAGGPLGPPLVHKIYEPNHHPDAAFFRAAQSGVRAHHWQFGDMPAVPGVSTAEVTAIIAYIRGLQREAGIN